VGNGPWRKDHLPRYGIRQEVAPATWLALQNGVSTPYDHFCRRPSSVYALGNGRNNNFDKSKKGRRLPARFGWTDVRELRRATQSEGPSPVQELVR